MKNVVFQSEESSSAIGTEEKAPVIEHKTGTLAFLEAGGGYEVGSPASLPPEAYADATPDVSLSDFFSRPARIYTFTWNESDALGTSVSFNPWQLFFAQTPIQNKLLNYAWLKCDLKVKILVNASPFYYGAMLAAYTPLPNFHPNSITQDAGTRYFIPYSQRPHVWIYPQNNEGGEMTLPFLWQKNWLSTVAVQDFIDMGNLAFLNVSALQSANGVSGTGVTISVYAWAENVVVSGPTCGLLYQSDEYGQGAVSSIASAVATSMKALSKVPIIGKYATATQMGAEAVASVASRLGFSNPPVLADVVPFKPTPLPPLATTEISYPFDKLTVDSKNELSVDPSLVGLPSHDELSISHMCGRESYLTVFPWTSTNSTDDLLFSTAVTPMMFDLENVASKKLFQTPMCYIGNMFQYWRGDIIIRLRFVCSQYHRGRVRIIYDPSGNATQNILNTPTTQTTCFNEVVDLTKDTNVEIRVPFGQALAWCQTFVPTAASQIPFTVGNGTTFNHVPNITNGTLAVRCVTALTAPTASSTIQCIVSVRGADNLEFASPQDVSTKYSFFASQSAEYEETTSQQIVAGHAPSTAAPGRFLINHGENVVSLRQLLRRMQYSRSTDVSASVTAGTMKYYAEQFFRLPIQPGYDPTGIHVAKGIIVPASNFPYNFVAMTYLSWLTPSFIGTRGSVNWAVNIDAQGSSTVKQIQVARYTLTPITNYASAINTTAIGSNGVVANFYCNIASYGASSAGAALQNQLTNGAISFQAPMYSAYKFNVTSPSNSTTVLGQDDTSRQSLRLTMNVDATSITDIKSHWYTGAGTDFTLVFFLNVPTVFVYASSPIPV